MFVDQMLNELRAAPLNYLLCVATASQRRGHPQNRFIFLTFHFPSDVTEHLNTCKEELNHKLSFPVFFCPQFCGSK